MVVVTVLSAACIGINPDYDEEPPPQDSVSRADGTATAPGDAGTDGDTTSEADDETGSCPSELARCGQDGRTYCADLLDDDLNCGACSNACGAVLPGSSCRDGVCECPHGGGWRICGARCAQTRDDPRACGPACADCSVVLGPLATCRNGTCHLHDPDED